MAFHSKTMYTHLKRISLMPWRLNLFCFDFPALCQFMCKWHKASFQENQNNFSFPSVSFNKQTFYRQRKVWLTYVTTSFLSENLWECPLSWPLVRPHLKSTVNTQCLKVQLISKCLFGAIVLTKKQRKYCKDF